MNKTEGIVYKAQSDLFRVKTANGFCDCNARGALKRKSDGICVGDYVYVENKTITEILPRKNKFIRPNVSNVDVVLVVISPEPKPDFYLIDKLVLNATKENAEIIFIVNKNDVNEDLYNEVKEQYSSIDVKMIKYSAKTGEGQQELIDAIKGKLSVLAGQSAVGKTSIVNSIFNLSLKTGGLSLKISRGKHTTTRSEIFEERDIKLVDSPGFAVIDADVNLEELPKCYVDYDSVSNECKFRGCSHVFEPDCAVKRRVENGVFSRKRYERYVDIYTEISKRRKIYEKN